MGIPEGYKKAAVLCLLQSKDSFLLLRRIKNPYQGKYTPIGGKIDKFETPRQAAIREVFEESGFSISSPKFCGILTETSPTRHNWINYIYLADIGLTDPPACSEGELAWVHKKKLHDIPTPTADAFIYKYVAEDKRIMFDAEYTTAESLICLIDAFSGAELYRA